MTGFAVARPFAFFASPKLAGYVIDSLVRHRLALGDGQVLDPASRNAVSLVLLAYRLLAKRRELEDAAPGGRMVFSVIEIEPNLCRLSADLLRETLRAPLDDNSLLKDVPDFAEFLGSMSEPGRRPRRACFLSPSADSCLRAATR